MSTSGGYHDVLNQQVLAEVVITKKNCLRIFSARLSVISDITGNLPLI